MKEDVRKRVDAYVLKPCSIRDFLEHVIHCIEEGKEEDNALDASILLERRV